MILTAALLLTMVPTAASAQPARRAEPLQPLVQLISNSDYPVDAIMRDAEGRTRFELAIDQQGMPYACRILEPAKEPSLNRVTCDIFMARARFRPAVDASGRPVPDTYESVVEWRLPEEVADLTPFEPSRTVVRAYSTLEGVTHCEMREDDHVWPRLTRDQCLTLAGREIIDSAESSELPGVLTMVTAFSPDGHTPEKDPETYGLLSLEAIAAVRISSEGTVTYCQTVALYTGIDVQGLPPPPDYCDGAGLRDVKFTPASSGGGVRSGRFMARFYVRPDLGDLKPPQGAR